MDDLYGDHSMVVTLEFIFPTEGVWFIFVPLVWRWHFWFRASSPSSACWGSVLVNDWLVLSISVSHTLWPRLSPMVSSHQRLLWDTHWIYLNRLNKTEQQPQYNIFHFFLFIIKNYIKLKLKILTIRLIFRSKLLR